MANEKHSYKFPDWLEQTISGRIDVACDLCEEHSRDLYEEFIRRLKTIISNDNPNYYEIENLFNSQIRKAVEKAYPLGLYDGASLFDKMRR